MNYELYITVIAFYLIIHGIGCFLFPKIVNRTSLRYKGRQFILHRLFGTTNDRTWKAFWLAVLWLGIYYFNYIEGWWEWLLQL